MPQVWNLRQGYSLKLTYPVLHCVEMTENNGDEDDHEAVAYTQ